MKVQKITFWLTLTISVIAITVLLFFKKYIDETTYDIVVGLFSGCVPLVAISLITYCNDRKEFLNSYFKEISCIRNLFAKYKTYNPERVFANIELLNLIFEEHLIQLGYLYIRYASFCKKSKCHNFLYNIYDYLLTVRKELICELEQLSFIAKHTGTDSEATKKAHLEIDKYINTVFLRDYVLEDGETLQASDSYNFIVRDLDTSIDELLKCVNNKKCNYTHIKAKKFSDRKDIELNAKEGE